MRLCNIIIAPEGWHSGESTHPQPMWSSVNAICGLSLVSAQNQRSFTRLKRVKLAKKRVEF